MRVAGVDAPARRVHFLRTRGWQPRLLLTLVLFASSSLPAQRARLAIPVGVWSGEWLNAMSSPAADFDGDGDQDLAVVIGRVVYVYLNAGGPFRKGETYSVGPWQLLGRIETGDVDRDGVPDLILALTADLLVLRGRGDGTFDPRTFPVVTLPNQRIVDFDVSDIDGDGFSDVLVGTLEVGQDQLRVYWGGRDLLSDSAVERFPSVGFPTFVAVADFNGDRLLDLVEGAGPSVLGIREGLGGRTFSEAKIARSSLRGGGVAQAADLDHDGEDELALLVQPSESGAVVSVADRRADGTYEVRLLTSLANNIRRADELFRKEPPLRVSDVNSDGWPDLLLLGVELDHLIVFRNLASGRIEFEEECSFPLVAASASLATGDFDGDGREDVATLELDAGVIQILFSPLNPCSAFGECLAESQGLFDLGETDLLAAGEFTDSPGDELLTVGEGEARLFEWGATGPVELATYPTPARTGGVVTGDLDGDGDLDFAVTGSDESSIRLYFIERDGALNDTLSLETPSTPGVIRSGDVNHDGRLDLVVCLPGQGGLATYVGEARGRFDRVRVSEVGHPQPQDFVIGDFDGDGSQDAMVLVRRTKKLHFLAGTDDGFFGLFLPALEVLLSDSATYSPGVSIHRADLDRDGLDDVVVPGTLDGRGRLSVVYGHETGLFGRQAIIPTRDAQNASLLVADLLPGAGVGIFTANSATGDLSLIQLEGGHRFLHIPLQLSLEPSSRLLVAAGDLRGDGSSDISVVNATGGTEVFTVACEEEAPPKLRRGDVDQDGTVGLTDAVTVLQHLFAAGEALACEDAADTDDNGTLNLADPVGLLAFLFNSGSAPAPPGPIACGEDPTDDDLAACEGGCQ